MDSYLVSIDTCFSIAKTLSYLNFYKKQSLETFSTMTTDKSEAADSKNLSLIELLFRKVHVFDKFNNEEKHKTDTRLLYCYYMLQASFKRYSLQITIDKFDWEAFFCNIKIFFEDLFDFKQDSIKNLLEEFASTDADKLYKIFKYEKKFMVSLSYFISLLINLIEHKFLSLERYLSALYDKYDQKKNGIMKLDEMEDAINEIYLNSDKQK